MRIQITLSARSDEDTHLRLRAFSEALPELASVVLKGAYTTSLSIGPALLYSRNKLGLVSKVGA